MGECMGGHHIILSTLSSVQSGSLQFFLNVQKRSRKKNLFCKMQSDAKNQNLKANKLREARTIWYVQ